MTLVLGLLNGVYHGWGIDHLTAVATLAGKGASKKDVMWLGLRFGLGHVGILLLMGGFALLWNVTIPSSWQTAAEILSGSLLVLLGLWTFMEWLREVGYALPHSHHHGTRRSEHTHFHIHLRGQHPHRHIHPHVSSLLGGLFALAGIRSLLMSTVPILQTRSSLWASLYILLFGMGIVVSMTAYGWLAGSAISGRRTRKWLTLTLACLSVGLGLYWISVSL
jgi:hypothetical protein